MSCQHKLKRELVSVTFFTSFLLFHQVQTSTPTTRQEVLQPQQALSQITTTRNQLEEEEQDQQLPPLEARRTKKQDEEGPFGFQPPQQPFELQPAGENKNDNHMSLTEQIAREEDGMRTPPAMDFPQTGLSSRDRSISYRPANNDDEFSRTMERMMAPPDNAWHRTLFQNKNALCMDGSPSGMYVRYGSAPTDLWIVHLGGNGLCVNETDCHQRKLTRDGSSRTWPETIEIPWGHVLFADSDPRTNPYFWDANHVFVPDCSGDAWTGQNILSPSSGLSHTGHYTLHAVALHLKTKENLENTGEVVLGGSTTTAGLGVMANSAFFGSEMNGVSVKGYAIDSWLISRDLYTPDTPPVETLFSTLSRTFKSYLPPDCVQSVKNHIGLCFLGPQLYSHTTVPLFIAQSVFSSFLLTSFYGLPSSIDDDEKEMARDFVEQFGVGILESLRTVDGEDDGLFAPACETLINSTIHKLPFDEAVGLWSIGELAPAITRVMDTCTHVGCGGGCGEARSATTTTMGPATGGGGGGGDEGPFPFPPTLPASRAALDEQFNPAQDEKLIKLVGDPTLLFANTTNNTIPFS